MFIPRQSNTGGRSLIEFNMSNYWQSVNKAKSTFKSPRKQVRTKSVKQRKNQIYETQEHLRNLMSLHGRIEDIGRWNHRMKNPCDPFAHPVLFFRTIHKTPNKTSKSSLNNTKKTIKPIGEKPKPKLKIEQQPFISLPKLNKILPTLFSFQTHDIKLYTEALVSAVQQFQIRTYPQLMQLQTAAIQSVPYNYPPDFQSIIKLAIGQISKLL